MSWFLAFVGFAALILLHEFGHFAAAKKVGMRVERFSLFFPPHVWKRQKGETEYAVGVIPLGGYVRITGMNPNEEVPEEVRARSYSQMPVWKRVVVIAAGPGMNLLIAFLIFVGLFLAVGQTTVTGDIDQVNKGSAAAGVLRPGDRLIAVDGVRGDPEALRDQIKRHTCAGGATTDGCRAATPAKVTVERDGVTRTFDIRPRYDAQAKRTLLGFTWALNRRDVGPVDAVRLSGKEMWRVSTATVTGIGKVFYDSEARKQVNGVVGSYETTRQAVKLDWALALNVLAIISLALALVNLFPFLPLDGGHIFWALAEKLRGRPIPYSVMERASVVGFVLIVMLFAVGLTNDIGRIAGDGFQAP